VGGISAGLNAVKAVFNSPKGIEPWILPCVVRAHFNLKEDFMPNTKQDRARVAGGQDHEVKYEAGKTGASKAEVKEAVKSEGNSRKRVEDKLGKK
jgi:hypothetical protein